MKHFLDIGGHHGETFDFLNGRYRDHVFWIFEPSPRHYAKLLDKCKQMSKKYDIRICPFGIGGRTGLRVLFEKDDSMGDSLHAWTASDHVPRNVSNGYTIFVSVIALANFILTFTNPEDEIVLDIDAEGEEYEILSSLIHCDAAVRRVTEVMVEWHRIREAKRVTPREFSRFCAARSMKLTNRGTHDAVCVG